MTITFDIPNGTMTLNLDQFLPEAGMNQIRKAIKLMPGEQKQEMAAWLKDQIVIIHRNALEHFDKHLAEKEGIPDLEQRIFAPVVYNIRSEEELSELKKKLIRCRRLSKRYLNMAEKAVKKKDRYVGIIEKLGV